MGQEAANSHPEVKNVLTTSPTMILSLSLYLTSINKSIGALLTQEVEKVEYHVYDLSISLQGDKMSYSSI